MALRAAPSLAESRELPQAPTGFHWEQATGIKAAFLTPDGWYFKADETAKRKTYFVSREDTAQGGKFQVGLTVNVNRFDHNPVEYARKV